MNILLVAGGDPANWGTFEQSAVDFFVGIDRGSLFLLERGIVPDLAVGDFDSLEENEKKRVFSAISEVLISPAEKDDTDTQLALVTVFQRFPEGNVTLIGATGGRLDHLLANLWLGVEPRFRPYLSQLTIQDHTNVLNYLAPGSHNVEKIPEMLYLGYCCLTAVTGLTLTDTKYTLENANFPQPTSLASNEFLADRPAHIAFESGIVAVIQSRDEA